MRLQISHHTAFTSSTFLIATLGAHLAYGQMRDPFGALATGTKPSEAILPLLKLFCPGHVIADSAAYGCDACPAGHQRQGKLVWGADSVIYGHFRDKDSEDALLNMSGCEPHADWFGGTVAFSRDAGRWRKLWYQPGLITRECKKVIRRDGREILLCKHDDGHAGETEWYLYALDIAASHKRPTMLLGLLDSTKACMTNLQKASVEKIEYKDLNGDGLSDIHISVQYGRMKLPRESVEKHGCAPEQKLPTRFYTIDFLFDGEKFSVAPASSENKKTIERD
jgi:hypothetical protein